MVAQRAVRADYIPDPPLELADIGEARISFALPDALLICVYPECASGAGLKCDFAQFLREGT